MIRPEMPSPLIRDRSTSALHEGQTYTAIHFPSTASFMASPDVLGLERVLTRRLSVGAGLNRRKRLVFRMRSTPRQVFVLYCRYVLTIERRKFGESLGFAESVARSALNELAATAVSEAMCPGSATGAMLS